MNDDQTNLVQTIKKICMDVLYSSKPCDVLTGKVVSTSPLKIKVSQKMLVTEEFLLRTETFSNCGFKEGDEVVLIRKQRGQLFLIVDKVVR